MAALSPDVLPDAKSRDVPVWAVPAGLRLAVPGVPGRRAVMEIWIADRRTSGLWAVEAREDSHAHPEAMDSNLV